MEFTKASLLFITPLCKSLKLINELYCRYSLCYFSCNLYPFAYLTYITSWCCRVINQVSCSHLSHNPLSSITSGCSLGRLAVCLWKRLHGSCLCTVAVIGWQISVEIIPNALARFQSPRRENIEENGSPLLINWCVCPLDFSRQIDLRSQVV